MTWNVETDYLGEYQYIDGLEDATFTPKDAAQDGDTDYSVKVLRDGEPTVYPTGSPLGRSAVEFALWLWLAGSGGPDPKIGDLLNFNSTNYRVADVLETRFGHFQLRVVESITNVDAEV